MAVNLHTTADELRTGYQAALTTNPNLSFDQYGRSDTACGKPGSDESEHYSRGILTGIASHKSIGQTLHDLG